MSVRLREKTLRLLRGLSEHSPDPQPFSYRVRLSGPFNVFRTKKRRAAVAAELARPDAQHLLNH